MATYTNDTASFISEDVRNPIKLPKAALSAFFVFALFNNSPINAPINSPKIIPPGIGDNKPKIRPIVVPIIPAFVPPKCFAPIAGMK